MRSDSVSSLWPGIAELHHLPDCFTRARAVVRRHAHLEVPFEIRAPVCCWHTTASRPPYGDSSPGEARAAAQIREIENQILDRITLLLQRSGHGQPFAMLEVRKDHPAPGGSAICFHESKLPPGMGGRSGDLHRLTPRKLRARPRHGRGKTGALRRSPQRSTVGVSPRRHRTPVVSRESPPAHPRADRSAPAGRHRKEREIGR